MGAWPQDLPDLAPSPVAPHLPAGQPLGTSHSALLEHGAKTQLPDQRAASERLPSTMTLRGQSSLCSSAARASGCAPRNLGMGWAQAWGSVAPQPPWEAGGTLLWEANRPQQCGGSTDPWGSAAPFPSQHQQGRWAPRDTALVSLLSLASPGPRLSSCGALVSGRSPRGCPWLRLIAETSWNCAEGYLRCGKSSSPTPRAQSDTRLDCAPSLCPLPSPCAQPSDPGWPSLLTLGLLLGPPKGLCQDP